MLQRIKQRIHTMFAGKSHGAPGTEDKFTCGTLKYTPATLAVLFVWLLWGDFAFSMMEIMPSLLGMQLKDLLRFLHRLFQFIHLKLFAGILFNICYFCINIENTAFFLLYFNLGRDKR